MLRCAIRQMSRRSSQGAGGGSPAEFISIAPPSVAGELSVNASTMAIKSVHMVNFMMNEDVVVDFGNRLNFICGPNGSGKSTVLCAILIGLCGDTKNLGRSTSEKLFIKSGKEFLKVIVTLMHTSGGRNDVIVTRKVTQSASMSSIDGRKMPKEEVLEWVKKQNIQFDNLCHFMAQTRVRLFAQLAQKPKEFLLQVEEAVGPAGQADLHRGLIAQNSEKQIAEKNKEQLQQDLERHKDKQKSLDMEMQRYQNLIEIQKQLESAEEFRPHLLADTEQQRFDEQARQIEPLQQEVAEKDRSLKGARDLIAHKRSEMNRASQAVEEAARSARKHKDDVLKKCKDASNAVKDVNRARSDLQGAQRDIEEQQERRENAQQQVQEAKDALDASVRRLEDLRRTGQFDQMEKEKRALRTQMQKMEEDQHDMNERKSALVTSEEKLRRELSAASNQRRRRFESATQCANGKFKDDLQKMYRFIETQNEQNKFRGEVVGPLAMELEFTDAAHAKVVQACIPSFKMRFVFLFADKDDFQLVNHFLIQQKLSVTIFDTSSLPRGVKPAPLSPAQLKQMGLSGFVMDILRDAPETIKNYLSQRLNFSSIFFGPEAAVSSNLREARSMSNNTIAQGIGFTRTGNNVLCSSHKAVVRGQVTGYEQTAANDPPTFTVGRQAETDTSALQERLDAVSRDVDAVRRQEEALANKMRSTRERLKEIENLLKEPQNLEGQIRSKRLRYDSQLEALNDMQSLEDLERNVVSKAAALKKKIVGFSQAYASAVDVQPQVWGLPGWCFVG